MERSSHEDLSLALVYALVLGGILVVVLLSGRGADAPPLHRRRGRPTPQPSAEELAMIDQANREISWIVHGQY